MKRRIFIQNSTFLLAAGGILPSLTMAQKSEKLDALGVALFTLPQSLSRDFEGTLKMVSEIGYRELEFYGPYPFSDEDARKRWALASTALGFKGSGYFEKSPHEVKDILDNFELSAPSIHVDLPTLINNMGGVAEAANIVGHQYVGIAMIPEEMRPDLDGYKKTAALFNEIGASAKKHGLTFFYHNHGYGHRPLEGQVPFQLILDETDPDLVKMQLDVFWFTAAGIDPVKYLRENPGRFDLLHVKDMRELKTFSGDGGKMEEWIGLFPYLADAGDGILDLSTILCEAKKSGTKHFLLEKDMTPDPEMALKNSYQYLSNLELKC